MLSELSFFDFIVFAFGLAVLLVWLFLYIKGKGDEELFVELNDEDYPLHDLYFVGYAAAQLLEMDYKNKHDRKLRKDLSAIYEERYADYYLRVVYAQRITMGLTILTLAAPMYFLSGNVSLFGVLVLGSGAAYAYYGKATQDLIQKKQNEYLADFSDVVCKLALMVNSGMGLDEAWEKVADSKQTPIYQEMKRSVFAMKNGESFNNALVEFGRRCMLPEIRKFTSTLIQGKIRGNRELIPMLMQQSGEVWEMKKQLVHRKGAMANDTLLLPMCITFIGILIMVMVPIFSNLGV